MKTRAIGAILLAAMMGAAATGLAAEKAVRKVDLGKLEYEANGGLDRIWPAVTPGAKAEAYLRFPEERAIPDYAGTAGNRGVHVLHRPDGPFAHFLMLTFWDSLESIRAFAGDDVEKAKYYPEDLEFLLDFEPNVTHYEVAEDP